MSDLTEDQAKLMLEQLSLYYKQPVLPLHRFCEALTSWARCIVELNTDPASYPRAQGSEYWKHLQKIGLDIRKSNLLGRLLYSGEKLRTRKCPKHKGHISFSYEDRDCVCGQTGWLPED